MATKKPTPVLRANFRILSAQRQQYKPYAYELEFPGAVLEINLGDDEIRSEDGLLVINKDGFKAILSQLSDAVDEVHDAYVVKARRSGRIVS